MLEALHIDEHGSSPLTDADLHLLRPLVRLRTLHARGSDLERPVALAELSALEHLCLEGSSITELAWLRGLAALRQLSLENTAVHDLGPLAELPNLTWLQLGRAHVDDLSPLRACTRLVELDLRRTSVSDLSPLHELRNLRLIFLHDIEADVREIEALLEALPELQIGNYHEVERQRRHLRLVDVFWTPDDC